MKRLVSALLAIFLILCLTCCKDNTQNTEPSIFRGSISADTYTSKTSGLTFEKPSQWRYLTDGELAQALSISEKAISPKEFANSLMEYPTLLDMMTMDDKTGLNMTIGYENLSVTIGKVVTEEEYIEAITEYLKTMGDMIAGNSETVKLSGQKYLKTSFSVAVDGVEMKTDYYVRVIGNYMNVITVAYSADVTDINIETMFK